MGTGIDDTIERNSTNNSDNSQYSYGNDKEDKEKIIEDSIPPMKDSIPFKEEDKMSTIGKEGTNKKDGLKAEEILVNVEKQESMKIPIKSVPKTANPGDMKNLDSKTCDECGKIFAKKKNLVYHKSTVHSKCTYPCSQCEYKGTRPDHLRIHIQRYHIGTKFPCPHCKKEFNFQSNCTAHIKSVHEKIKYDCSYCDNKYTDRGTLRQHVVRDHESF